MCKAKKQISQEIKSKRRVYDQKLSKHRKVEKKDKYIFLIMVKNF